MRETRDSPSAGLKEVPREDCHARSSRFCLSGHHLRRVRSLAAELDAIDWWGDRRYCSGILGDGLGGRFTKVRRPSQCLGLNDAAHACSCLRKLSLSCSGSSVTENHSRMHWEAKDSSGENGGDLPAPFVWGKIVRIIHVHLGLLEP